MPSSSIRLGNLDVHVLDAPGHTAGHILFYLPGDKALFSGDTLFPMGCGRLFEGRPEEMFGVLKALEALPGDVRVYCAHEYTEANGRFALVTEPENVAIIERMRHVGASRLRGEPTVPTTIALERATNPFMRARSVEEFSQRRAAKDNF
jgi:hydroxyacylglutathione hydrolase